MPLEPTYTTGQAQDIAEFYSDLETKLLTQMRVRLNSDMTVNISEWERIRLLEVQSLRKDAVSTLRKASPQLAKNVNDTVNNSYKASFNQTTTQFTKALKEGFEFPKKPDNVGFANYDTGHIEAFQKSILSDLSLVNRSLIAKMDKEYVRAINNAVGLELTGLTRRKALQSALNDLAKKGLTVVKDRAGRNWSPRAYTEMLMRTQLRDVQFQATKDRAKEFGWDLIQTSQHMNESELCAPWSNKVLTMTTLSAEEEEILSKNGVVIDGTWDEAIGDGYKHPNCKHTEFVFIPGITTQAPDLATKEERIKQGDLQKQQRYYERKTREWKNREALSVTPEEKAFSRSKVSQWQKVNREFSELNNLPRMYDREQLLIKAKGAKIKPISPKATPVAPKVAPKAVDPKASIKTPASVKSVSGLDELQGRDYHPINNSPRTGKFFKEQLGKMDDIAYTSTNRAQFTDEGVAIRKYTGQGYKNINKGLRDPKLTKFLEDIEKRTISELDSAFAKATPLGKDIQVYRNLGSNKDLLEMLGIDIKDLKGTALGQDLSKTLSHEGKGLLNEFRTSRMTEFINTHMRGASFVDDGFMSTSRIANKFNASDSAVSMIINVPKEATTLFVENISSFSGEAEVLFNRGSKLVLQDIRIFQDKKPEFIFTLISR